MADGRFRISVLMVMCVVCASWRGVAAEDETLAARPAKQVPLASKAVFLDLAFAGQRIVAVGERGIEIWSDDQGGSWQQASVPVRATLTAVTFLNDRLGFAVGHESSILRTDDAGKTWELLAHDPTANEVHLGIRFRSPQVGYVVSTNGRLLSTRDGGQSWSVQTLQVEDWYQNHLFDIAWTRDDMLVAAEKGVIYRSTDGGANWASVQSPYEGSFFGMARLADTALVLFGMSGRIYLEQQDGEWERVDTETEQFFYDAWPLDDGGLLIVGAGGTIVRLDARTHRASVEQRANRAALTAVAVAGERVYLASAAGGITVSDLGHLTRH